MEIGIRKCTFVIVPFDKACIQEKGLVMGIRSADLAAKKIKDE